VVLRLPFARDAVGVRDGTELLLGLRPERMTDERKGRRDDDRDVDDASARIEVRVDVVEPTGPDNLVVTELGGNRIVCRVRSSCAAAPGDMLPLTLDLSKAVLFDAATGARVDRRAAAR
jgi:multiple sugar transport system ATP-binding protein